MLSALFGRPSDLRELVIRVCHSNSDNSTSLLPFEFIVCCPSTISISELRNRILGLYNITTDFALLFCGRTLENDCIVPDTCFENLNEIDQDNELFRCRIVLVTIPKPVHLSSLLQPVLTENPTQELELNDLIGDQDDVGWQEDKQLLINEHFKSVAFTSAFNLELELSRINCKHFFDTMREHGFDNEGSFALLNENDLKSLWIPARPRARILALADAFKSKLMIDDIIDEGSGLKAKSRKAITGPPLCPSHETTDNGASFPCCEKHERQLNEKRNKFSELGVSIFCAELEVSLRWIGRSTSDIASINEMTAILLDVLARHKISPAVTDDFKNYLATASIMTVSDIHTSELAEGEVPSSFSQQQHSKKKFVEAAGSFGMAKYPNLFLHWQPK